MNNILEIEIIILAFQAVLVIFIFIESRFLLNKRKIITAAAEHLRATNDKHIKMLGLSIGLSEEFNKAMKEKMANIKAEHEIDSGDDNDNDK